MNTSTATINSAVSAAAIQNSRCRWKFCATHAAIGSPTAPPMPSVALTRAIAPPSALGMHRVAQDADPERDHADADTLQGTPDHHREERVGQRADHRTDQQQAQQHQMHAPLAEHVGEGGR